jgi:photosystem II stability/assembly factor-like uncharacterized protein
MKTFLYALLFVVAISSVSKGQFEQVYQTDSSTAFGHYPIMGMKFFGRDSGIVFANNIATTTNGGISWQRYPWESGVPETHSLAFLDIDHSWATESGYVYRSYNSGVHWNRDSVLDEMGWNIKCLYFQDTLIGFAGADGLTIFRTSDGGKSWERKHGPEVIDLADYYMEQFAFATPSLGLAASGNFGTWILRTTDNGMTWTNLTDSSRAIGGFRPTGLSFPDPANAFFSTQFHLYHSSDSGKTWSLVKTNPSDLFFRSISFIDSLHGVAAATGSGLTIGYTSDGGINWKTVSFPAKVGTYWSTSFPEQNTAYISGYDAVYRLDIKKLSSSIQTQTGFVPSLCFEGDRVLIHIPGNLGASVRIINILGQVVEEESTHPDIELIFSMQRWPTQVFIEVHCSNKIAVFKVLH